MTVKRIPLLERKRSHDINADSLTATLYWHKVAAESLSDADIPFASDEGIAEKAVPKAWISEILRRVRLLDDRMHDMEGTMPFMLAKLGKEGKPEEEEGEEEEVEKSVVEKAKKLDIAKLLKRQAKEKPLPPLEDDDDWWEVDDAYQEELEARVEAGVAGE